MSRLPDPSQTTGADAWPPYSTSVGAPCCSPPPSHQATVDMIQGTYLWGSKPMSLGNTNWAGSVLAASVKSLICKAKGRGGDGWGWLLVCLGAKMGFDEGEVSTWVLFWSKNISYGNFFLVFLNGDLGVAEFTWGLAWRRPEVSIFPEGPMRWLSGKRYMPSRLMTEVSLWN